MEQQVINNITKRSPIQSIKDCWHLARPYWSSEEKWRAIGLIAIVIVFNLLVVYMSVLFNKWNNAFYDSLQHVDKKAFFKLIIQFSYYAFFYILFQIVSYFFRKTLEIRWRKWLTNYYINNWLHKHAYYKTRFVKDYVDNPDQRISQDINGFIGTILDLSLGLVSNIVSLCSFVFILYSISGPLAFTILGHHIVINGYMVWAALLYAVVGTYITFKIGRPLIKLNFRQENVEADFRFGLMRVREYAENIAFYHGENQESRGLKQKFTNVVDNFMAIVYRQMKLDVFNVAYSQIANIFPIMVAAPRYFAKQIQLGDLMQIASAFGHVQGSLSFFIDGYGSLASLRAIMDRMYGFQSAIESAQELPVADRNDSNKYYLQVSNFALNLPDSSRQLANNLNFALASGERLLIKGESGSGKTTLLRALAGLWPYTSGNIYQNSSKHELFIAQRPYLPNVSLREAICYPLENNLPTDDELQQLMKECGLSYLVNRLTEETDWSKMLSLGEQQRIAFARVIINKPDIIYLDEATSALDEAMEQHLYSMLINKLPKSVIISVGHRSTLSNWHTQELNFNNLTRA